MPDKSQAVPCPVPVPNSRSRPPGFDAARTANNAPTFGSETIVKSSALVSLTMAWNAGGVRLISRSFIEAFVWLTLGAHQRSASSESRRRHRPVIGVTIPKLYSAPSAFPGLILLGTPYEVHAPHLPRGRRSRRRCGGYRPIGRLFQAARASRPTLRR